MYLFSRHYNCRFGNNLKQFLGIFSLLCTLIAFSYTIKASDIKLKADSLLIALEKSKGTKRCDILNSLSSLYSLQDPNKAESYALEALKQAEGLKDSLQILRSKISLALSLRYQRKFQEVLDILNPTLTYINKVEDKNLIAEIFNNIGVAHFQLGHSNQSIGKFFESLKIKQELSDQKGMSAVLNNIGNYFYQTKNFPKALEFYTKSMYLDSMINDTRGLAFSFYNIGKVYQSMGKFNDAKVFFIYASKVSSGLNNPVGKAYINFNLAEVYEKLNRSDSAIIYLDIADSLNRNLGLKDVTSSTLYLRGMIYDKKKQYDKAIPLLNKANNLFNSQKDSIKLIQGLVYLGGIFEKTGNNNAAKEQYEKALNISSKYKLYWLKADALIGLASIYKHIGDTKKSTEYLWDYVQIKDSISKHLRDEVYAEIEVQRGTTELEKKIEGLQKDTKIQNLTLEKEETRRKNLIVLIAILLPLLSWLGYLYYERRKAARFLAEKNEHINQQNEELNAINDQLNLSRQNLIKLNQTKDKFFSIVAHDLKSPLVSLRSYLYAIRTTPTESQESFKSQVHDIEKSLNTILDLLNNLLFWALSQEDKIDFSPETFNLFEIIEPEIELARYLGKEKGIKIEHNLTCCEEVVTDKNMLLFILRNLTSNALRYTPEKGTIKILYEKIDKIHLLKVVDNGTGIEPVQQESLFDLEKKITRKSKGTGLGLMLCKEFTESMGGDIKVESEVGKGSTFIVSFPDFSS